MFFCVVSWLYTLSGSESNAYGVEGYIAVSLLLENVRADFSRLILS